MSLPWDFSAILYNNVRINDGEFNLSADLDFMDSVFQPLAWLNHGFLKETKKLLGEVEQIVAFIAKLIRYL